MEVAIKAYPESSAVLVERHGIYVWGPTWESTKTQTECLDYLFEVFLKMKQSGLDPAQVPQNSVYKNEVRIFFFPLLFFSFSFPVLHFYLSCSVWLDRRHERCCCHPSIHPSNYPLICLCSCSSITLSSIHILTSPLFGIIMVRNDDR